MKKINKCSLINCGPILDVKFETTDNEDSIILLCKNSYIVIYVAGGCTCNGSFFKGSERMLDLIGYTVKSIKYNTISMDEETYIEQYDNENFKHNHNLNENLYQINRIKIKVIQNFDNLELEDIPEKNKLMVLNSFINPYYGPISRIISSYFYSSEFYIEEFNYDIYDY